jgi:hypothetical protein
MQKIRLCYYVETGYQVSTYCLDERGFVRGMFDSSSQPVPEHNAVGSAVVVGASLSGLMTALMLSRYGLEVDLLERSADSGRTGAALYVEPNLVQRLTGSEPAPNHRLDPGVQTWHSVHNRLLRVAEADPRIRVRPDMMVTSAAQDTGSAWVITHSGEVVSGDIVIGADGHRSTVRAAVAPESPHATFAGYVIWLGLLDESAIEGGCPRVSGTVFLDGTLGPLLGGPFPALRDRTLPGIASCSGPGTTPATMVYCAGRALLLAT